MRRGAFLATVCLLFMAPEARAQVRGVNPPGVSAFNSGVTPAPGLTYANNFVFFSRSESVGPSGEILATGQQSVLLDLNPFVWVTRTPIAALGDAVYSFAATVIIANNSLSSSQLGALSGGGGLGDTYFQPLILGWKTDRADFRAALGVVVPTGRFNAGANDNVGNGYWTLAPAAGQTFYLTNDKATTVSLWELYEFHSTQSGTDVHPGQTLNLDYSLARAFPVHENLRLQVGLVGYEQLQTTDRTGPDITPEEGAAHYKVHALGFGFNVISPPRNLSVGFKYFDEFSNGSTYQGHSVQISATVGF